MSKRLTFHIPQLDHGGREKKTVLEGSETLCQSSESHSDLSHRDVHMMKCHGYFRKLTLGEVFGLEQTTLIQTAGWTRSRMPPI